MLDLGAVDFFLLLLGKLVGGLGVEFLETSLAGLFLGALLLLTGPLHDGGDENTDLVENDHRPAEEGEGHKVGRSEDSRGDEDDNPRIGPGRPHDSSGEKLEFYENGDDDGQLEADAEDEDEPGDEGDVFSDPVDAFPALGLDDDQLVPGVVITQGEIGSFDGGKARTDHVPDLALHLGSQGRGGCRLCRFVPGLLSFSVPFGFCLGNRCVPLSLDPDQGNLGNGFLESLLGGVDIGNPLVLEDIEKLEGDGSGEEKGKTDSDEEQDKADRGTRDDGSLLDLAETREDELEEKVEGEWKGDDDPAHERELEHEDDKLGRAQGNELETIPEADALGNIGDGHFRRDLDEFEDLGVEGETADRRDRKGRANLHEGVSQVLEMIEEWLLVSVEAFVGTGTHLRRLFPHLKQFVETSLEHNFFPSFRGWEL